MTDFQGLTDEQWNNAAAILAVLVVIATVLVVAAHYRTLGKMKEESAQPLNFKEVQWSPALSKYAFEADYDFTDSHIVAEAYQRLVAEKEGTPESQAYDELEDITRKYLPEFTLDRKRDIINL